MIPVRLPSGREILLVSPNDSLPDVTPETSPYRDVSFHLDFRDLVEVATEIGVTLRSGIDKIRPSKANVELNIGVDVKSGAITAFLVDGGVNGSIKIALEWERDNSEVP
ncbi:CU044_2847 family protein [Streptomyces sp. NPDC008159]|uniref:CU044_2847 family protein n=1 Tax=Streptomyces sp. NPDC008159 TaxID=3364817 RepID=UPI0036ED2CF3